VPLAAAAGNVPGICSQKNMKSYHFNLKLSRGLGYAWAFRLASQVEAGVEARVVARVNAMGCA
jgi:hypothetical protein